VIGFGSGLSCKDTSCARAGIRGGLIVFGECVLSAYGGCLSLSAAVWCARTVIGCFVCLWSRVTVLFFLSVGQVVC